MNRPEHDSKADRSQASFAAEEFLCRRRADFEEYEPRADLLELLRTSDIQVARAVDEGADRLRRLQRHARKYMHLEEGGGGEEDAFDYSFRFWRTASIADADWWMWKYRSPNPGDEDETSVVVNRVHNGGSHLSLAAVPAGLSDHGAALWVVGRDLSISDDALISVDGSWHVVSGLAAHLAEHGHGRADWSAVPRDGLPDLSVLRARDRIDPRATRSDLESYPKKLAWETELFGRVKAGVPRLAPDDESLCPIDQGERDRAVNEQNTFTLPEGADGRVDSAPDHFIGGVVLSRRPTFLRTGQVGTLCLWVWAFTDKVGNDCFLIAEASLIPVREPKWLRVHPGYSRLDVDQILWCCYCRYLERENLRLERTPGGWSERPQR